MAEKRSPEQIGRYVVRRALGGGGMGDVYHVFDPVRRRDLALKTLKFSYPRALHYFKREFRAAARLTHRNLVTLYDLHLVDGRYFYTMELIDGVDLYHHVNGSPRIFDDPRVLAAKPRMQRLREALVQLLRALAFLHGQGYVHRDIKPSNVLVNREGRVKLVDFGIVKSIDGDGFELSLSQVIGTPVYMSPEQSQGSKVTPASDMYACGVVLYELLAGVPPFEGDGDAVGYQHRTKKPPSLVRRVPGVPPDLALLCMSLLAKELSKRPGAREALKMVGAVMAEEDESDEPEFVGRRAARKALHAALDGVRRGDGRMVVLEGASGSGKTALVRAFAAEARMFDATLFSGVCVQRDHVPVRGLDTVIERLADAFRVQMAKTLRDLPPAARGAVIRLLPFLGELLPPQAQVKVADQPALPQRAGEALGTLLGALARQHLLILCVEHLHLADALTLELLECLQAGGRLPPALFILTVRPEAAPPRVRRFLDLLVGHPGLYRVAVGPFEPEETRQFVHTQLESADDALAARLHAETGGEPLFLAEMVRYLRFHPDSEPPRMAELVARSISRLPAEAGPILASLSLCPEPVPAPVLERATGVPVARFHDAIDALEGDGFVRAFSDARARTFVAPVHARLMEIIRGALPPGARDDMHRALAAGHEAERGSATAIAHHWFAAGTPDRAPRFAVAEAQRARAAGDHERAVAFLRLALTAPRNGDSEVMRGWLADSLTQAGRYAEAAAALEGVIAAEPERVDRWRARQAELYLLAGDLAAFMRLAEALPPGPWRVRVAAPLLPFDPERAAQLLGDDTSPAAKRVRAVLLAGDPGARSVLRAERLLSRAEAEAPSREPADQVGHALARVAVLRARGAYTHAQEVVEEAAERFRDALPAADLARLRLDLARARAALDVGQLGRARSRSRALVLIARERRLPGVLARVCIVLARAHLEAGELHITDRLLDEAVESWPPIPAALPHAELALTRTRRHLYAGNTQAALATLGHLSRSFSLGPFLERRETAREATLLEARCRAVLAIEAWRRGGRAVGGDVLAVLRDVLKRLRRVRPVPETWLTVFQALLFLVGGQVDKAIERAARPVNRPDAWPDDSLILAVALFVLSAAREVRKAGTGAEDLRRAHGTLRRLGAAAPPEAVALGVTRRRGTGAGTRAARLS